MTFIRRAISAFNLQTYLLLAGIGLIVAGLWILLGYGFGLVALGVALILIALLINRNSEEGR